MINVAWLRLGMLGVALLMAGRCSAFGGVNIDWPFTQQGGLPIAVPSKVNGLIVRIDFRWFETGGYRPARVVFEAPTPATRDRRLLIRLLTSVQRRRNPIESSVEATVVLPAGRSQVETVVLCPLTDSQPTVLLGWQVEIDGAIDPELSVESNVGFAPGQPISGLRVLKPFMGTMKPLRVVEKLPQKWPRTNGASRDTRLGIDRYGCDAFANWVAYSSADVLTFDLRDLRRMADEDAQRTAAVRHWLLSGGTVWVERVADQANAYREVETLLGIEGWRFETVERERDDEAPPAKDAKPDDARAQQPPSAGAGLDALLDDANESEDEEATPRQVFVAVPNAPGWGYRRITPSTNAPAAKVGAGDTRPKPGADTRDWYARRAVGFGQIYAFRKTSADVPLVLRLGQSETVKQAWQRRTWTPRHGVDPGGRSPQFGNLLIPGVGVAPVIEFQFLITLFVLAIGPLNYWLLWRRQQRQLLVITAPLCAAAVTLGLVGYAAVADGFGVLARARSVTLIDQSSAEATSWSRVSHYAPRLPDDPPTFPKDCVAYPISPVWDAAIKPAERVRRVVWDGEHQQLTSGWIPSRTTVQHLLLRSGPTQAKLVFTRESDGLRVANRLGPAIELLLVRDSAGDWRQADNVDADAVATLRDVTREEALLTYRTLAIDNQPTYPAGAGQAVEQTLERLGASRAMRRAQRSLSAVNLGDSLGEVALNAVSGLDGGRGLDLPPRSYVAVTREAVETPLGWADVEEVESFHVTLGRW